MNLGLRKVEDLRLQYEAGCMVSIVKHSNHVSCLSPVSLVRTCEQIYRAKLHIEQCLLSCGVRLSRWCIVSKQLNLPSNFSHCW